MLSHHHIAAAIRGVVDQNKIPLVIGGNCSVLIGAGLALKQKGSFGLFHLDGHTDYMWPEFSQTGGAAGMGLALVAGIGHQKLTNIGNLRPYFIEENIFCAGNREYDDEYVALSLKAICAILTSLVFEKRELKILRMTSST